MDKLVTLAGYDDAGPHIFRIEPDRDRAIGHIKMARPLPQRVEHYIKTARPIPGKTQLLIDALGASEYWPPNANGDAFPEAALRHDGSDYGFRTFEKYAHPFRSHINSDPKRAYGDRVTLSEYDPAMHRVLLIVSVHDEKCRDILSDLANNRYYDVSMGARVPFDICSICRNRARTRADYCPHLRYQMRKILSDGRQVCAINTMPKFFDISFVSVGAEKASHVLKKVAHDVTELRAARSSAEEGERFYGKLATQRKASATKEADIDKQVPSNVSSGASAIRPLDLDEKKSLTEFVNRAGAVKSTEPPLPNGVLDLLSSYPLNELAATLTALGIPLKPEEFQRIILVKSGQTALADKLERHEVVFDELKLAACTPSWARSVARFDVGSVNPKIAAALRPFVADRSCYPEPLLCRLERLEKRADDNFRDPMIYNRQWYPLEEREPTRPPDVSGFVPAGLALAAGLMLLKRQFAQLAEEGPLSLLAKHPWLVPILVAGGVGASVGLQSLLAPKSIKDGSGSVDAMGSGSYAAAKTASMRAPWMRIGLIPLAYIYAGMQRQRAARGEPLGSVDSFVASRPDLAAISTFAVAPTVERGVRRLLKRGSVATDVLTYAVGAPSKFLPGVLAGALFDSAIFHGIARLGQRRKEIADAYAR